MTALIVLGANDEQTTCDACGKIELRKTVILGTADRVEVGRYGTTCASRKVAPDGSRKITASDAQLIEAVRRDTVCSEIRKARRALAKGEHVEACWRVTQLEKWTFLHRADEFAAIAAIREGARALRAELRAAGTLH